MIFKCLATGNTVEFTQQHDIDAMLKHHQYAPVEESPVAKNVVVKETPDVVVKEVVEKKTETKESK